jgi:DMSO/TMAO reductase YedYZ heme-binding membrane subunit
MDQVAWYASRATGIVATALAVAALVWGFFFSARNTGARRGPAWWLDLHNWLGGLALAMTAVHLIAVYLDQNSGVGAAELLVPGASSFAITWGVIAAYLLAVAVFTSWPRKRLRPTRWRIVHLGSVLGAALAGVHAYQAGSDAAELAFQIGLGALAAFGAYAAFVRILAVLLPLVTNSQPTHSLDQGRSQPRAENGRRDRPPLPGADQR